MRRIDDLKIWGPYAKLLELLRALQEHPVDGWKRDREREVRHKPRGLSASLSACFTCAATSDRPAVEIRLNPRSEEELYVWSISPLEKSEWTDDKYNHILAEFESRFLQPVCRDVGVTAELIPFRVSLKPYFSSDAIKFLQDFLAAVAWPHLRREDRNRWNDFLLRCHLDNAVIERDVFDAWLEQEGWPEEQRHDLIEEYLAGQNLLANYDEELCQKCRR